MLEYHRTIVFTKTPLKGSFRFKGLFQIYPADLKGMPYSNLQSHHPVILEYTTTEDDVITPKPNPNGFKNLDALNIRTATKTTKEQEILNLLSLFSNHYFFRYYDPTGTWGMPVLKDNPGNEANKWSSKWSMKLFHWPELPEQLGIDSFKNLDIKYVEFVDHESYYLRDPNFDHYSNTIITFPNSITTGLNAYFSIDKEAKAVIDAAISYAVDSMEIMQHKKTLSIISAFTALETMVNYEFREFKPEVCAKCSQPQYKVAQKFRDFLSKYLSEGTAQKRKFNALYSYRSKIIHTGQKLKTENLWNNLGEAEEKEELISQLEAIQYSKLSIIHWLIHNNIGKHEF
jgi:hypothetical protein